MLNFPPYLTAQDQCALKQDGNFVFRSRYVDDTYCETVLVTEGELTSVHADLPAAIRFVATHYGETTTQTIRDMLTFWSRVDWVVLPNSDRRVADVFAIEQAENGNCFHLQYHFFYVEDMGGGTLIGRRSNLTGRSMLTAEELDARFLGASSAVNVLLGLDYQDPEEIAAIVFGQLQALPTDSLHTDNPEA